MELRIKPDYVKHMFPIVPMYSQGLLCKILPQAQKFQQNTVKVPSDFMFMWACKVTNYRISQPIRRNMIFSLEILEKKLCWMYFNFSNLLEENRIVTYQN